MHPPCYPVGAYYYYHTESNKTYQETVIDAVAYERSIGIPVATLQVSAGLLPYIRISEALSSSFSLCFAAQSENSLILTGISKVLITAYLPGSRSQMYFLVVWIHLGCVTAYGLFRNQASAQVRYEMSPSLIRQVPAPLVLHNRMFDWPSAYSDNYTFEVALTQDMALPVDVRTKMLRVDSDAVTLNVAVSQHVKSVRL